MPPSPDLENYFERIDWRGGVAPTRRTLAGLLRAHMRRIPFENLDVLLGRPVRIDLASVERKLVQARRGGYCFEHATLFAAVLERLGFNPLRHAARVTLVAPRTEMPRTHMFLSVTLAEGTFLLDPGFGMLAPQFPVPLIERSAPTAAEATDAAATHWMVRAEGHWILRASTGGKTVDCWATTMEVENPVDFEMANHFTSTWPASAFVNRMMLRALTDAGRITLMNRDLTVWRGDVPEPRQVADRTALRAILADHFGFDLPEVEQMRVPSIPEWA